MPDWEWWQYMIVIVVTVVAVRVVATFNITDWIKHRHERRLDRLRALCPHTELEFRDGEIHAQSLIGSPPMTVEWVCQRCGTHIRGGETQAMQIMAEWGSNPLRWAKRTKKFTKLAKRLGYL